MLAANPGIPKAMLTTITLFENIHAIVGQRRRLSWDAIFDRFARPTETPVKEALPLWAPATFANHARRHGSPVETLAALVLDFDHDASLTDAVRVFGGLEGFIHSSFKHREYDHRFRVILPFDRAVAADKYPAVWRGAEQFCRARGLVPDGSCKNASRIWYVPGRKLGAPFESRRLRGRALGPAHWAAMGHTPDELSHSRSSYPIARESDARDHRLRRASAYLAQLPPSVSGERGHEALWNASIALVRGFGLAEDDAFHLLKQQFSVRCSPPWSDREISHKIRDALRARVPHGYLTSRPGRMACR